MGRTDFSADECAIAQALQVVGDPWTLLVVRDIARGRCRFDQLRTELGVSTKVLAQRLALLVEHGVLARHRYAERPPRFEYRLTERGRGLLPVLVTLQDFGSTWVLGDGARSATTSADSIEAERVHGLIGTRVPDLLLAGPEGRSVDPIAPRGWTVLYCYPGTSVPGGATQPPGWSEIPGAPGCSLEARTYCDRLPEFTARQAHVLGVSTQRPDEQAAFAAAEGIQFPLASDAALDLVTALRLPTFRMAGTDRLKRLTLIIDAARTVRGCLYPIQDVTGSVGDALARLDELIRIDVARLSIPVDAGRRTG